MPPFRYCLNTSTIHGQGLTLPEEIDLVAQAGYAGIEPWVREVDAYVAAGGDLDDLGARVADAGLTVENLIGFFAWGGEDDAQRAAGLTEARRNLELARRLGCTRLAAPPMGMPNAPVDLDRVAERYRELLELGRDYGVVPVLEFWGMSPALGRLSQALYVALASDQRDACVLADVFHMYKSGGGFQGLRLLGPETLALVHVNDYPADPPRAHITDAERVYPGDGVAPYGQLLADLTAIGFHGPLSIELFNPAYYAQEARTVATTALAKLRALVEG